MTSELALEIAFLKTSRLVTEEFLHPPSCADKSGMKFVAFTIPNNPCWSTWLVFEAKLFGTNALN
jgi:hypothetical protein